MTYQHHDCKSRIDLLLRTESAEKFGGLIFVLKSLLIGLMMIMRDEVYFFYYFYYVLQCIQLADSVSEDGD